MKEILKFMEKHKVDIFFISIIIVFSIFIRLFLIDEIPTNITGDESWDLSNVYRIVFAKDITPLTFLGDGSVPAIIYFPVALLIKMFGTSDSILFLRLNIIVYSILSVIAFYFILKEKTSRIISFLFTLLLSSNYVFLNFSRTAWINMISVFSGLFLILFIEKATKEKNSLWYLIAGIFAGISFYGYHYGRILTITVFIYLFIILLKNGLKAKDIKGLIIFWLTTLIICLPFLVNIFNDKAFSLLRRPQATFAFSQEKVLGASTTEQTVFFHQLNYTLRGLILFDDSVMSNGVENQRYTPLYTPPVNLVIKILFWGGLIYLIFKRKYGIWWFVFVSILITQFLSDLPPNFSRGLFYIPFIYFVSGFFLSEMLKYSINSLGVQNYKNFIYMYLIIAGFLISLSDINVYFEWMKQPYEYNARQPAIDYREFYVWQDYQINLIKNGQLPIVNQEWYMIRNNLIIKD
ncbi:MAG: glycosyltransferase family 39 protein [Patescibacteria group bacterium]